MNACVVDSHFVVEAVDGPCDFAIVLVHSLDDAPVMFVRGPDGAVVAINCLPLFVLQLLQVGELGPKSPYSPSEQC